MKNCELERKHKYRVNGGGEEMMTQLDERKVLVTGGAGFIGSEMVRQLCEQNADVTVLDNFASGKMEYIQGFDGVKVVKGDICDEDAVPKVLKDEELVIHLAALPFIPDSYYHPKQFFKVNTIGSINMIQGAIHSETVERFVHISSSEVYGTAKYVPMNEEHPTLPHSTYAASKLAADRAVFTMHKEHDFPTVIVRPFNSYGPNITQPYIIPEIILQLLTQNEHIKLGNVESLRDFTYVSDTARGIILASLEKRAVGETINLGSNEEIKMLDLATLIAKLLAKQVKVETNPARFRPYDVDRLLCDNTKAKKMLGWEPEIALEDGLKRAIEWIVNNPITFKGPFKGWYRTYHAGGLSSV